MPEPVPAMGGPPNELAPPTAGTSPAATPPAAPPPAAAPPTVITPPTAASGAQAAPAANSAQAAAPSSSAGVVIAPVKASPFASGGFRMAAQRAKIVVKFRLLRVRYVLGYLAGSFLVSVPIDFGYQLLSGNSPLENAGVVGVSVLYGALCLGGFFALRRPTAVPWERVRVPEYALFEMEVAGWATIFAGITLLVAGALRLFSRTVDVLLPLRLFWMVFALMGLSWAKIRVQTYLFPEFYADRGGERILSPPPKEPPEKVQG